MGLLLEINIDRRRPRSRLRWRSAIARARTIVAVAEVDFDTFACRIEIAFHGICVDDGFGFLNGFDVIERVALSR